MAQARVIVTDCDHENIDVETALLEEAQITFELKQCKTEQDVIEQCQGAEVLLNQYAPFTEEVLERLPDLKLIVRYGVGVNNVDLEAATKCGIQVCNVPDYGMHEVADHALALMLALTRKITVMNDKVKSGVWDYQHAIPLFRHKEQTVGVVGLGRIGTAFAEKVHGLGCNVIAYDPNGRKKAGRAAREFVEMVDLETLLTASDIISIHCPLDTAKDLFNKDTMGKMKPTAYLINVSRGGIINEADLNEALTNKQLAGAAVDVAEVEPIGITLPLLKHENFLCTPHMAWYSEQSANELKQKVAAEAVRFLKEGHVTYPVNEL